MDVTHIVVPKAKPRTVTLRNWYLRPRPNSWHVHLVGNSTDNPVDAPQQFEFVTSTLKKRVDKHRMLSGSGSVYILQGPCNVEKMLSVGYPKILAKVFSSGFPTEWKGFLRDEAERRRNEQTVKQPEEQSMSSVVNDGTAQQKSNKTSSVENFLPPEVEEIMEVTSNDEPVFRVPVVPRRPKASSGQITCPGSVVSENTASTSATVRQPSAVSVQQPVNQPEKCPKDRKPDVPVVSDRVLRKRQLPEGVYAMDKLFADICKKGVTVQSSVKPPVKNAGLKDTTNKKSAGQVNASKVSEPEKEPKKDQPPKRPRKKTVLEPINESAVLVSKPAAQRKKEIPVTKVVRQKVAEERPNPAEESMLRRSNRLTQNASMVNYADTIDRSAARPKVRGRKFIPPTPETAKKAPVTKKTGKPALIQPEVLIVASVRKNVSTVRAASKMGTKKKAKQPKRVSADVAKKALPKKSIPETRSPIVKKAPAKLRLQPARRSTLNFTIIEETDSEGEALCTPPTIKKKPKRASKPSAAKVSRKSTRLTVGSVRTPAKKRISAAKKKASLKKAARVSQATKTPSIKGRGVEWWRKEIRQVEELQQNAVPARLRHNGLFDLSPSVANLKLGEVDWDMDEADDFEPVEHTDTTRTFRMSAHSRKTKKRTSEFDFEPSNAQSAMERLNFQGYLQNEKQNAVKNPRCKPSANSSIWSTGASASATYMNIVLPSIPAQLRDGHEF